ncbi:MAG: hypothetical protein HY241_10545 [Actinobacteria bacterium]|nr:hypothetical protein [Actinomycetota bacterium]
MSELEFDLLGEGYAAGFGRVLTAFLDHPVDVRVSRHHGHLYSTVTSAARKTPFALLELAATSWTDVVLPTLTEHISRFRRLADEDAGPAMRQARGLFSECVALHHAMLSPARKAIVDLLSLSRAVLDEDQRERGEHAILGAVTATATPTVRAAEALLDEDLPEVLDDARAIALVAEGACDGDGYGLTQPGWLDDATYAHRMRGFLRRFGVTRQVLRSRLAAAADHRSEAMAELGRRCPALSRPEVARHLAMARVGAVLAETHGPIMHVRYVHELQRLVLAHGRRAAERGVFDESQQILHLRLAELDDPVVGSRLVAARHADYQVRLRGPLPAPVRRSWIRAARSVPPAAAARLGGLGTQAGRRAGSRTWQGVAAAPGAGCGPLRVLRSQPDLERLQPGDVALVPDDGPAWGWLALAGVALIVEHGGRLGHAPALARECGAACVVGGAGVVGLVAEGEVVKVAGDAGTVTW